LKKNKYAVTFFFVFIILPCIVLGVVARKRNKNFQQSINTNPVEPFYTNPDFVDGLVVAGFKAELKQLYAQHSFDSGVLGDTVDDNAARFAIYWMASDPYNNMDVHKKEKLNRFVLACFYYSTNMVASPYATEPMY
jgi:hypothetical protein